METRPFDQQLSLLVCPGASSSGVEHLPGIPEQVCAVRRAARAALFSDRAIVETAFGVYV